MNTIKIEFKKWAGLIGLGALSITFLSFQNNQAFDLKASIDRGKGIYAAQCASCHQDAGEGIEEVYPPLAKSDYMMADKNRSILQVIKGTSGEMLVNGKKYNAEMAPIAISDKDVSDVLNFVRNSFGNKGVAIIPEEVKALRK